MSPLVRLTLDVDPSYVRTFRRAFGPESQKRLMADVGRRLEALGYSPPLFAAQDPTQGRVVRALVRQISSSVGRLVSSRASRANGYTDTRIHGHAARGPIRIMGSVLVEEPNLRWPARKHAVVRPAPATLRANALDEGLGPDDVRAITYALDHETNPRHLVGFAEMLEPSYPIGASLLRVRSATLEPGAEIRTISLRDADKAKLDTLAKHVRDYETRSRLSPDLVRDEVRRAVCRRVHVPEIEGRPSHTPTNLFDTIAGVVTRPVVSRRLGPHGGRELLFAVDDRALRAVLPPRPDDGFISPTALQLAHAEGKPVTSAVSDRDRVRGRLSDIDSGSPENVLRLRARAAVERARRALDRSRWVEYYRTIALQEA